MWSWEASGWIVNAFAAVRERNQICGLGPLTCPRAGRGRCAGAGADAVSGWGRGLFVAAAGNLGLTSPCAPHRAGFAGMRKRAPLTDCRATRVHSCLWLMEAGAEGG